MQCNIDAKGKAVRLISGIIVTAVGLALLVLLFMEALRGRWMWALAIGALLLGAFQIYEARKGWCVMRAMGFRTPI